MHTSQSSPNTLNHTVSHLTEDAKAALDRAPGAISEAAAQLQALTRRGLDGARELGIGAREKASRAGYRTQAYIQDEPVKAVLIAAAAGAVVTLLASFLTHRRD